MPGESQQTPETAPDPSVLSTEQLIRGLRAERDYTDGRIELILERLRGIDRATSLLNETVNRTPTDIQKEVTQLRELLNTRIEALKLLIEERTTSVQTQFKERDDRSERECLSADEPVLCADLIWRRAGDLAVGDELIAVDEEPQVGRKGRCYRRAVVTANSLQRDRLVAVTTSHGTVRCNAEHPWLMRDWREGRRWRWVKTGDLHEEAEVMNVLDVWEVDRSYEAGWLAGMLDGEGWLGSNQHHDQHGGSRIIIAQVIGALDDEIGVALEHAGIAVKRYSKAAIGNAREQSRWQVDSRPDIMRLLGTVRPKRLMLKADDVWEGRTLFGKSRPNVATVMSIADAGMGTIAMLSTSTGTYIGAGFPMHNSRDNKVAVDAAFAAQKESATKQDESNAKNIDKSELSLNETIRQIVTSAQANHQAQSDKIDDLKDRVKGMEANRQGGIDARAAIYAFTGFLVSLLVIGGGLAAAGAFRT